MKVMSLEVISTPYYNHYKMADVQISEVVMNITPLNVGPCHFVKGDRSSSDEQLLMRLT
jgi:hypothetical protein